MNKMKLYGAKDVWWPETPTKGKPFLIVNKETGVSIVAIRGDHEFLFIREEGIGYADDWAG